MGDTRNTFFSGDILLKRTLGTIEGSTNVIDFRAERGRGNVVHGATVPYAQ
jgi:hypothetical protein